MAQIPTAEETLKKWQNSYKTSKPVIYDSLIEVMKEFAKLHVKEALKAALEDAPYGSSTDTVSYEDMKVILDAYPETNIK